MGMNHVYNFSRQISSNTLAIFKSLGSKILGYISEQRLVKNYFTMSEQADSRLLDLPSSIIIEILTRTPLKDILNCRCVCQNLRDLISDPTFVSDFISRTPFLSILLPSTNKNYCFVKLLDTDSHNFTSPKLVNTSFIRNPKSYSLEIIGCSNGLVCFLDKFSIANSKFYITNPVLGEVMVRSNPSSDTYAALEEIYGFFSCPNPEEYKIVKIKTRGAFHGPKRQGYCRKTEVWILGVGSGKWSNVGDAPFPLCGRLCRVILNGRVHWIADSDNKGPINLYSLDITKEQARSVPSPHELSYKKRGIELGVMGGSLCIFDSSWSTRVEIWSMREYGVAASWTKWCIRTNLIRRSIPVAVHENWLMIMMSRDRCSILCCDLGRWKFAKAHVFHGNDKADVMLYTPSFLSLDYVSKGAFLKVRKVDFYT